MVGGRKMGVVATRREIWVESGLCIQTFWQGLYESETPSDTAWLLTAYPVSVFGGSCEPQDWEFSLIELGIEIDEDGVLARQLRRFAADVMKRMKMTWLWEAILLRSSSRKPTPTLVTSRRLASRPTRQQPNHHSHPTIIAQCILVAQCTGPHRHRSTLSS